MTDFAALNDQHGISGQLEFGAGPGGLAVAEVANARGKATIALQGGQVLNWAPRDTKPVVWLPRDAPPTAGRAIRGGVPVCWPWFGPHASEADFPSHGFARTAHWHVVGSDTLADGATRLVLRLEPDAGVRKFWPHPSLLECRIDVGQVLELVLTTFNRGSGPIAFTEALHAYFNVGDVRQVAIQGLDGCAYLDKVDGGVSKRQSGAVTIDGETDRIYVDTVADCLIEDPSLQRRIRVSKQGSQATVVWNPWLEKAEKLGDLGENGYLRMVCVETANAAHHLVSVAPGEKHSMTARYQVEPL